MDNLKGVPYLRAKLTMKTPRIDLRYKYYDMKAIAKDLEVSTPPDLRWLTACLGWCGAAVDEVADRLTFREFRDDNFGMNEIFELNNMDILTDSACRSALISACSFIYISPDENGYPRLQVIDGRNATGIIDPITYLLKEGYAVLERDSETDEPIIEAYFTPRKTFYYEYGKNTRTLTHEAGIPLLVPVIFRPSDKRPFGHSRISRACMALQDSAARTLKRSEVTAEFYSFPQKWVTGLEDGAEKMDKWKASVSALMAFTKDSDGESPQLGQFTQQSVQPHLDQFRLFASAFAGETGLTLDDLGFPSANPASYEAIKASHERLRLVARKAQKTFGIGLLNAGYVAACLLDKYHYKREAIYMTKPVWEPMFEPDYTAISGAGDAIVKINQAVPDYLTDEKLRDLLGF